MKGHVEPVTYVTQFNPSFLTRKIGNIWDQSSQTWRQWLSQNYNPNLKANLGNSIQNIKLMLDKNAYNIFKTLI